MHEIVDFILQLDRLKGVTRKTRPAIRAHLSGYNKPSKVNEQAFHRAIDADPPSFRAPKSARNLGGEDSATRIPRRLRGSE